MHYSRLLYIFLSRLFIRYCFYYSLSIFSFILLLVLLLFFKFYLILCWICSFISYLCYCINHHFYYYLSQKCRIKISSVILVFLWTYMETCFIFKIFLEEDMFSVLLSSCFNLLLSVFLIYRRVQMSLKHYDGVFSGQVYCRLP